MSRFKMVLVFVMVSILLCGCGSEELTKTDVSETEYYKKLSTDYKELQRKYEKLNEEYKSMTEKTDSASTDLDASSDASSEALDHNQLMKSLKRYICYKMMYSGGGLSSKSGYIDNSSYLTDLKNIIGNSIEDTSASTGDYSDTDDSGYVYTLYLEDNSIVKLKVFTNDRFLFLDSPEAIYYCEGISRVARGYFENDDFSEEPKNTLFGKLYECPVAFNGDTYLSVEKIKSFANNFSDAVKKKLVEKPADVETGSEYELTFSNNGDTYILEVYEKYVGVIMPDESEAWYELKGSNKALFK